MNANEPALARGVTPNWRDHLLGFLLAAIYTTLLLASSSNLGMNRDEGFYVDASESYARWWGALFSGDEHVLERASIDAAWENNHEHPSLPKSLFAMSWLAQQRWHVFAEDSMAFRFPGMAMSALSLWVLYLFGTRLFGRRAGLFAALSYALIPAVFYHAHLDCFDTPIVSMLLLVTYGYYRSLTEPVWAIWTGVAYGFCLETKHNAWILPLVFLVHFIFVIGMERARRKRALSTDAKAGVALVPWWLIGMVLLGPPLFIGMWPWMWNDTIQRTGEYIGFHINHVHYNLAYLGHTYFSAPSPMGYAWVTTAFTVPFTTLLLGVIGIVLRGRAFMPAWFLAKVWTKGNPEPDRARTDVLLFGSFFTPMFVLMMPSTPIFGGTKHFLMAYAVLMLFGGYAFTRLCEALSGELERLWKRPEEQKVISREGNQQLSQGLATFGLLGLFLAPAARDTAHSHPFGLSFYTALAGGVPGAADLGMNRQFWGFTTGSLVPWFNRTLAPNASVWICDSTYTAFHMLQRDDRLRDDIRVAWDLRSADYAIVHHEDHFNIVDFQIWEAFGRVDPVYVLRYDGVPIVSVYENPHTAR